MPKVPMDYSKTHIYKIVCNDLNVKDCYLGHTTNFAKRKNQHKRTCYNEKDRHYNIYLYKFIRENGGWENFDMILINTHNLNNSMEARQKEREYIEQIKPSLNKIIPYKSKEEIKEYVKEWSKENATHLQQYKQGWYLDRQDDYKQKFRNYYNSKKEEMSEKSKEKMICDCGSEFRKKEKARHLKSIKHQQYLQTIEN